MSQVSADLFMKIMADKLAVSEDAFLLTPRAEKKQQSAADKADAVSKNSKPVLKTRFSKKQGRYVTCYGACRDFDPDK